MDDRSATAAPLQPSTAERLLSLDARLCGFDMFWIIGGEEIVSGLKRDL